MDLKGHSALITGGASGLGEATARALAQRGAKVALLDVNLALAEQLAGDIGADRAIACQCDSRRPTASRLPSPRPPGLRSTHRWPPRRAIRAAASAPPNARWSRRPYSENATRSTARPTAWCRTPAPARWPLTSSATCPPGHLANCTGAREHGCTGARVHGCLQRRPSERCARDRDRAVVLRRRQ